MELVESFEEEGRWRFSARTRWEKQIRPVLENNCTAWQIYITLNSTFHIPAPTGIRFHSDLCHLPFTPGGASRCLDLVCITLALLNGLSISFSFIFQKCYQWELVNYFLVYPIQGKYHWGQFDLGCWSDKHIMVRVIEQIPHQSFKVGYPSAPSNARLTGYWPKQSRYHTAPECPFTGTLHSIDLDR